MLLLLFNFLLLLDFQQLFLHLIQDSLTIMLQIRTLRLFCTIINNENLIAPFDHFDSLIHFHKLCQSIEMRNRNILPIRRQPIGNASTTLTLFHLFEETLSGCFVVPDDKIISMDGRLDGQFAGIEHLLPLLQHHVVLDELLVEEMAQCGCLDKVLQCQCSVQVLIIC